MSAICDAHKKKVDVELLNNSVHKKFNQLVRRCWIEEHVSEMLGPQVPGWAAQENGKETRLWPIEWGVNMLQFCSVSNSLSHTTLSNKVRCTYFSKELCRSSLLCRLHACMHMHMYCGYTTFKPSVNRCLMFNWIPGDTWP